MATAGAGLLLALSVPVFAGAAGAAPEATPPAAGACDPAHAVTAYHFTVNGKTVNSLHASVHQGDHVEAFFTIAESCSRVGMALVAHTAPDAFFVPAHASQQKVFDGVKATFGAGSHTMGPVSVPPCNFQVDFAALATKAAPGHTYSSATGGSNSCTPPGGVTTTTVPKTTTSVAPTTTTVASVLAEKTTTNTLPLTGSDSGLLVGIAAGLLVAGGAMAGLANRSNRSAS
jgi:hypothetical protein